MRTKRNAPCPTYKPQSISDDTAKVLESLVDNLPAFGKRILTKFIIATRDNNGTLFNLSRHLYTRILVPSEFRFDGDIFFHVSLSIPDDQGMT